MRDYLSAYLRDQHPAQTAPSLLTKLPKLGSVSYGSTKVVNVWPTKSAEELVLSSLNVSPRRLTKQTKPVCTKKAWRREPHYPSCIAATMVDGNIQHRAAGEVFVALALGDGHDVKDAVEMLQRVSPTLSMMADYGRNAFENVEISRDLILTDARLNLYIAHHPFAWELQLTSLLKGDLANEQIS